jgi:hypothetical protein
MKQLLLNFLLIFGSAYAFIQCAQLLTSNNKIPGQHSPHPANISNAINNPNKVAAPVFQASNTKFNFENNPVGQFFGRSSSLNMMGYFDIQTLFYYPNINFTSFDLFSKYPDMLKHDKSK